MLRWCFVLCLGVGAFFAWKNWPSLSTQTRQLVTKAAIPLNAGTIAVKQADGSTLQVSVPLSTESWGQRDLCGLRLNLPFQLQSVSDALPPHLPPGMLLEVYAGKTMTREVILTHAVYPTVRALPLWAFNIVPGPIADRYGLQVLPKNPATILNGLRAQRTDCLTTTFPPIRYRMLLLERGSQMWLIETHTPEKDEAFEPLFQKIILSAQLL